MFCQKRQVRNSFCSLCSCKLCLKYALLNSIFILSLILHTNFSLHYNACTALTGTAMHWKIFIVDGSLVHDSFCTMKMTRLSKTFGILFLSEVTGSNIWLIGKLSSSSPLDFSVTTTSFWSTLTRTRRVQIPDDDSICRSLRIPSAWLRTPLFVPTSNVTR